MSLNDLLLHAKSLWTVWFFLIFVGVVAWTMWPSRRRELESQGRIPLQDDDQPRGGHDHGR
ncbi:MAG: cbb3-type cytochrome c oxidase subunit 3 [Alphaproteobacteria bacterium]|nr:cbb3-type cytochrome c oxidase subunit 3 [Alphaproteobacteria bacterium]